MSTTIVNDLYLAHRSRKILIGRALKERIALYISWDDAKVIEQIRRNELFNHGSAILNRDLLVAIAKDRGIL